MTIAKSVQAIKDFQGSSLRSSLSAIEAQVSGLGAPELDALCQGKQINFPFMEAAAAVKQVAGQINVIIHAAGILCSLPCLLEPGEQVESVSLGAGNTGRKFDLETNRRIAEFKFIDWRGGPESIRQNGIFKDFFELAEHETQKRKQLFVIGTEHPMRFFGGGRALSSVLGRNPAIMAKIRSCYGPGIAKVREYYALKQDEVEICDVSPLIGRVE